MQERSQGHPAGPTRCPSLSRLISAAVLACLPMSVAAAGNDLVWPELPALWQRGIAGGASAADMAAGPDGSATLLTWENVLVRYGPDGAHAWTRPATGDARRVTAGRTWIAVATRGLWPDRIEAYSLAGERLWSRAFPNILFLGDIDIGPGDNLVFTGTDYVTSDEGTYDVYLSKATRRGDLVWQRFGGRFEDQTGSVGVDVGPHGAIGAHWLLGSSTHEAVRYGRDGRRQWSRTISYVFDVDPAVVVVDRSGGIGVGGYAYEGGVRRGVFRRYDAAGGLSWRLVLVPSTTRVPFAAVDVADAAALPDGTLIIGGRAIGPIIGEAPADDGAGTDAWMARVDAAGRILWLRRLALPGNQAMVQLEVDPAGNLFAVVDDDRSPATRGRLIKMVPLPSP
jgi:hypothetical protein